MKEKIIAFFKYLKYKFCIEGDILYDENAKQQDEPFVSAFTVDPNAPDDTNQNNQ